MNCFLLYVNKSVFYLKFLFAENLEKARLMVVSRKVFLPIEGGSASAQFAAIIAWIPLCRNGKLICRNYCVFWKVDNFGYYE